MLVSIKYDFAFLCTPKCASSSIHAALTPYSDIAISDPPDFKHTQYTEYHKYIAPYVRDIAGLNSIETVCLIREPIAWLYSWYRFRARYASLGTENSTANVSFSEFVEAYMSPNQPPFAQVGSQFRFVRNEAGEVGVDKIFAYENIDDFLEYMSAKIGVPIELGRLNVSPKKRYESSAGAFMEYMRGKLRNKLNVSPSTADVAEKNYGLADSLMNDIQTHLADDRRVYEMAKQSRPLQTVAAQ